MVIMRGKNAYCCLSMIIFLFNIQHFFNLIKIQLFIILSYKHLTAAIIRSCSCADDLCNFHLTGQSKCSVHATLIM